MCSPGEPQCWWMLWLPCDRGANPGHARKQWRMTAAESPGSLAHSQGRFKAHYSSSATVERSCKRQKPDAATSSASPIVGCGPVCWGLEKMWSLPISGESFKGSLSSLTA
ncbi:hypothetical protein KIL84_017361 [Mauremys mutica]|uniref:Uncharacterized protein n=1 Tax=Mauremys mutica TaxID=74926 RepID=A0A9D3X647_9SAUR|nr:hypothetical protein KIL84_017361 [Mauremys mutica]